MSLTAKPIYRKASLSVEQEKASLRPVKGALHFNANSPPAELPILPFKSRFNANLGQV